MSLGSGKEAEEQSEFSVFSHNGIVQYVEGDRATTAITGEAGSIMIVLRIYQGERLVAEFFNPFGWSEAPRGNPAPGPQGSELVPSLRLGPSSPGR